MMTFQNWEKIIQKVLPDMDVADGPVQEPPRAAGRFARVWQSGMQHLYDDGLAEVEWTITVHRSTRGRQDLGTAYFQVWEDVRAITEGTEGDDAKPGIDRTEYSIVQLRADIDELPVDGYVSVAITATEAVEVRTAWRP